MSLLAHVELGVEMMEFDEPFALELPHPFRPGPFVAGLISMSCISRI